MHFFKVKLYTQHLSKKFGLLPGMPNVSQVYAFFKNQISDLLQDATET